MAMPTEENRLQVACEVELARSADLELETRRRRTDSQSAVTPLVIWNWNRTRHSQSADADEVRRSWTDCEEKNRKLEIEGQRSGSLGVIARVGGLGLLGFIARVSRLANC
jgi:hypothetical protein